MAEILFHRTGGRSLLRLPGQRARIGEVPPASTAANSFVVVFLFEYRVHGARLPSCPQRVSRFPSIIPLFQVSSLLLTANMVLA